MGVNSCSNPPSHIYSLITVLTVLTVLTDSYKITLGDRFKVDSGRPFAISNVSHSIEGN